MRRSIGPLCVVALCLSSVSATACVAPAGSEAPRGTLVAEVRLAGICPHERFPGDPECVPRPQAGVTVVVRSMAGREVARATSAADGRAEFPLAAGGYTVEGLPDRRFFVTARPAHATVEVGRTVTVTLTYNTGNQ